MHQLLTYVQSILPATSLFRSNEPAYLLILPLLLSILESYVLLQLALRSFAVYIELRKLVLPGMVQGLLVFLARQLIPIPFHLLAVIVIVGIIVYWAGQRNIARAAISTLFTESVVIVGSIFVAEPILMLAHPKSGGLLNSSLGFSLGTVLETIIPAIVLAIFIKYRFALGNRSARPAMDNHEDRQV